MKKTIFLLIAMTMATLTAQANDTKEAIELSMASAEADVAAATEKAATADENNSSKEEAKEVN